VEIVQGFAVQIELALVKTHSFPKNVIFGRPDSSELLAYVGESSTEREIESKLDKANEVTSAAAAVAVKDIFGCIDVEGRGTFGMQWAQSDKLLVGADWSCRPVTAPQIFQQRDLCLQIV
jgi:hypothetical protein